MENYILRNNGPVMDKPTDKRVTNIDIPKFEDTLDLERVPELRRATKEDLPILEPKMGRPKKRVRRNKKESAAIMREYRDRMLASPKSRKVLDSIWDAALDPEDKDRASAWKIVVGVIMPSAVVTELFESDQNRSAIQINITGITSNPIKDVEIDSNNDVEINE